MSTRKRNIAQEVEFYTKRDTALKKRKDEKGKWVKA